MIENDNENKFAKKNGPVVKNTFRFIRKNLRFKYRTEWNKYMYFLQERWYCKEVSNLYRKLNESSVARKAYKN